MCQIYMYIYLQPSTNNIQMSYWKYYKINRNSKNEKKRMKTFQKLRDQNIMVTHEHDYGYELRMPIMLRQLVIV